MEAWILRALLVASLIGGFYWWADSRGYERSEQKHAAAMAKAKEEAEAKEDAWKIDTQAALEVQRDELDSINAGDKSALRRLRDEYKRLSEAPRASCDAASAPAIQLHEQGAIDLVAIGSDADRTAADLRACQAWVATVTK